MLNFTEKLNKDLSKTGVYLIKINKHMYVGSSINIKTRLACHIKELKKNKHYNIFMQRAFNKYTLNDCSYSILEECNKDKRLIKEKYWIDTLNPDLNLVLDPTTGNNSKTQSKTVYQYDLEGHYITSFISVSEASRILNIASSTIASCCRRKNVMSAGKYQWSYKKVSNLNKYINKSSISKIKEIFMYNKIGQKIKNFNCIADAARYLQETDDNFNSLCAIISAAAKSKGKYCIKDKFIFNYIDKPIIYNGTKNFPIIQETFDGKWILWNSTKEAADALNLKTLSIIRVIKGERKTYAKSKWLHARTKQGELLETPTKFIWGQSAAKLR